MSDQNEIAKEVAEHPTLPKSTIMQIVQDHSAQHGRDATRAKFRSHWARARFGRVYLKAGQQAPKGANMRRGPHGGYYYDNGVMSKVIGAASKVAGAVSRTLDRDPTEAADSINTAASKVVNSLTSKKTQGNVAKALDDANTKASNWVNDKVGIITKNPPKVAAGKLNEKLSSYVDKESKVAGKALDKANTSASSFVNKEIRKVGKALDKENTKISAAVNSIPAVKKFDALFRKRAKFGTVWRAHRAKHSGLGQIPQDYTKRLQGQRAMHMLSHGKLPEQCHREARHSIGMNDYATLDVAFLREGDFRTGGVPYHYPLDVIKRDAPTFQGKGLYINHSDATGTEMGVVDQVYTKVIDGVEWLCAKIKVPETTFTQDFLDRIQSGLIQAVSSTHDFFVDPQGSSKDVKQIRGKALSVVPEGEVEGARIMDIQRHNKENGLKAKLAKAIKNKRGR